MDNQVKKYFIRVILVNFFSLLYLIETTSFDYGFFSIQSIFYSINIYLLYFFILFETLCSYLSLYGLDFNFYKLIINNLNNLNYEYISFIFYQNINFFYFLIFSTGLLFFLEKTKYNFDFKKNSFNSKKIILIIVVFVIFILTNFNPNYTNLALVDKYKGLTNNWSSNDLIFKQPRYYKQLTKDNFFRNDNWYNTIKYSFYYSGSRASGPKKIDQIDKNLNFKSFRNFGEVILKKKYNNIFVIIKSIYSNTWVSTQGVREVVATEDGSKPGDPLADIVWNLMNASVLDDIETQLIAHNITYTIEFASNVPYLLKKGAPNNSSVKLLEAPYVDDVVFIIWNVDPRVLKEQIGILIKIVHLRENITILHSLYTTILKLLLS